MQRAQKLSTVGTRRSTDLLPNELPRMEYLVDESLVGEAGIEPTTLSLEG